MNREIETALVPINEVTKENPNIPKITRNKRGEIVWQLRRNTLEQNEQIGISNIQALFLQTYPDFNELFPRGKDGKIAEDKREGAKSFILTVIQSSDHFFHLFGRTSSNRTRVPCFEGSYIIALQKSFEPWGITFNWRSVPDGWLTINNLSKQLKKARQTIAGIASQFRETHPEWFNTYVYPKSRSIREHLSPELVSLITQKTLEYQQAPDGWMAAETLAKQMKGDWTTIKKLAKKLGKDKPGWFKIHLDRRGRLSEHYSPELISLIMQERSQYQPPPEGWIHTHALASSLGRDWTFVRDLAHQFRQDYPEYFKMYRGSSGRVTEYYSQDLIEEVTKILNEKVQERDLISPDQANEQLMKFLEAKD